MMLLIATDQAYAEAVSANPLHCALHALGIETTAYLTVQEWVQERLANTYRLAAHKPGADRAGWLADAAYYRAILEAFAAMRDLLREIDSGRPQHGRCLDHLPRGPVDIARHALEALVRVPAAPTVVTPTPRPPAACKACNDPTTGSHLCGRCWAALPAHVKDAVYDADDGPNGPHWLRALDVAVKVAKAECDA